MRDDDEDGPVVNFSPAKERRSMQWLGKLARTREGAFQATAANALIIMANDPQLIGMVAFNAFRAEHLITRSPPPPEDDAPEMDGPYPRAWGAADITLVLAYFQRVWSPKFVRGTIEEAMVTVAARTSFHPVRDWLARLKWDGKPRLDAWLVNTFACDDTPLNRAIAAMFMIAAVRRARQPGCKFDYMLVLEGAQGIGKSRTMRALFGEWFSDDLHMDLGNKEASLGLLGVWCIEFAEIEHMIRNEPETIKAFLSRQTDRFRAPYGKGYMEYPRQGVFVGTTNADDYLRDATGNRRIWPVRCLAASVEYVLVNRDQLWAEAAHREAQGEPIWLDKEELQETAARVQTERMAEDVWAGRILDWLADRTETTTADALTLALGVPVERQGRREEMRVAAIMKTLKWTKHLEWRDGKPRRLWRRPAVPF